MQTERQRINILNKGFAIKIKPGRRLPIMKINELEYTGVDSIRQILLEYQKTCERTKAIKTLVVGHGHTHPNYSYLPKPVLMLDINPIAVPDILGDMKNTGFMSGFSENYFDQIFLMYTPPPNPFHPKNNRIWINLKRLLRPDGVLKSLYVYNVYFIKLKRRSKQEIVDLIKVDGKKWFSRVTVNGSMAVMIK